MSFSNQNNSSVKPEDIKRPGSSQAGFDRPAGVAAEEVLSGKARIVQEYVPGKQVTLAHIICNPRAELCEQLGVENQGAIGIMTITPGEGAIIAADAASKAGSISLEFVDRFTGCLIFSGDTSAVESALNGAVESLNYILGFCPARITRT